MRLYNTLTRQTENFEPLNGNEVRIYSCGPTVYDHIHIGNLSAFVYADTLRRTLQTAGYTTRHVMNFTDIDDKTIARSQERYPDDAPETALHKLTSEYTDVFLEDMERIGNEVSAVEFIKATESIEGMRQLIAELYEAGFAYVADDGVYFSIERYVAAGKTYGQLSEITTASTAAARIQNDEYDKDSAHDFALWKIRKPGEPSWPFELDGKDVSGRPGWHIECSAMSVSRLGQPFDIHSGGIDLIFPHHENEIAQSTAENGDTYAKFFFHNEHLLVDGRKMSKSLDNFYTLRDIQDKGYDPKAFRLMVLQSHYRSPTNFSWDNLDAAQNRLKSLQTVADLRFQPIKSDAELSFDSTEAAFHEYLKDDINTPMALALLSTEFVDNIHELGYVPEKTLSDFTKFLQNLDKSLGLGLLDSVDIDEAQKSLIAERQQAREQKDWEKADKLRQQLLASGLSVRDTEKGTIWSRS